MARRRLSGVWLSLNLALLSSSPIWPKLWARHLPAVELPHDPLLLIEFQKELHAAAIGRTQKFLEGVRLYQSYPFTREQIPSPARVIWQKGTTRLLDYGSGKRENPPILAIPSLINRYDILDLDFNHSLLRHLVRHSFHALVVDWGMPGEEEKNFSIGDYIQQRLIPMVDFLKEQGTKPHILGYCMGGLLALALALLRQEGVRSLTLMTTPWHTGQTTVNDDPKRRPVIGTNEDFQELMKKIDSPLSKLNYLPVSALQALFAWIQPTYAMKKFARFADQNPSSTKSRHFVLTEDWLNDGVPLTAPVTRELFGDIYGQNATGKLQWKVCGQIMDPRQLHIPACIIVAGKDKIVPPEAALPLARLIRGATLLQPRLGHIGLLTSDAAPTAVWGPLAKWLSSQG